LGSGAGVAAPFPFSCFGFLTFLRPLLPI
jgi:hypothetical protein